MCVMLRFILLTALVGCASAGTIQNPAPWNLYCSGQAWPELPEAETIYIESADGRAVAIPKRYILFVKWPEIKTQEDFKAFVQFRRNCPMQPPAERIRTISFRKAQIDTLRIELNSAKKEKADLSQPEQVQKENPSPPTFIVAADVIKRDGNAYLGFGKSIPNSGDIKLPGTILVNSKLIFIDPPPEGLAFKKILYEHAVYHGLAKDGETPIYQIDPAVHKAAVAAQQRREASRAREATINQKIYSLEQKIHAMETEI